jgi:hypothetical protein
MRRLPIMLGLAGAVLAASAISASAQQPLRHAGKLECVGGPSLGFVVASGSTLHCTLHQNRRRPQHYDAVVRRVGVDLGLTERWALSFNVFTPDRRVRRGGLAGSYSGAGSSLTIGGGAGSASFVGGPGGAVSLQPVPAQGQAGLNLAFGFQGIDLVPVRNHRHR